MRRLVQCMLLLPLLLVGLPTTSAQTAEMQTNQVIAFNVTVSLEWQPGTNDQLQNDLTLSQCGTTGVVGNYLDDLITGLTQASNYLALYTDGQMKLGSVTIYTGGANWNNANIRVLADSSYRPKAFVGGIVTSPMEYTSPVTSRKQTFYPSAIYLGRLWDGKSGRCGPWAMSDGYRTIGHEWAHYALYLYDEYYNQDTLAPVYCTSSHKHLPDIAPGDPTIDQTDSLMAYHYRAGQLWRGDPSDGTCDVTPQMKIHGESDWHTLQRFYPGLVIPSAATATPTAEPVPWTIASVSSLPANSSANVRLRNTIVPGVKLSGHGYLVRSYTDKSPQRIIGQGTMVTDEMFPLPFLGVEDPAHDRAVIIVQDAQAGAQYVANSDSTPLVIGQSKLNDLYLQRNAWKPCLSTTPTFTTSGGISQVTQLTVRLRDCAGLTNRVQLTYCPSGGNCLPLVTKTIDASGNFVHAFTFPWGSPPAEYGYIYARSADIGERQEETIGWYQLAGGVGPATITGHAPLLERSVDLTSSKTPQIGSPSDSHMLYSVSCPYRTSVASLPPDVGGMIDTPLNVQPVIARENTSTPWNTAQSHPALSVRWSYNQDLLNRLRITEDRLVLMRLDQGAWQVVTPRQRSLPLDWLAIEGQSFGGSGATFALGYLKD
ncbi:MAG TPA: hypothetical protein VFZ66_06685 [Herpetosiphonaceae bacterium]